MKISVIGSGYVGLVAGACFSDTGNTVYCVDQDPEKIRKLQNGEIPIFEPGLETIVRRSFAEGRLKFTTSTKEAVEATEIIFMAVGTPSLPSGEPDLSFLKSAALEVGRCMTGYRLIVNKSTVPIGTHAVVAEWISQNTKHPFDVASNPEFLKEGTAIEDFLKPDRVVIGTKSDAVFEKMRDLYAPFVRQGNPIIKMDPLSAEVTKYACNAFLATRISFMNELSVLCEAVGADIENIRKGMVTDVRIGKHFLYAGVGYGGSCFPKDVKALISTAERHQVPMEIVKATEDANARQKSHLMGRIRKHFKGNIKGKTFAIWGLAFKPNTDDVREAPAQVMIEELLRAGARVQAFDPVATENFRKMVGEKIQYCQSVYEASAGADAVVLMTEWNEFRHPDYALLKKNLKSPVIFDGRNIFDPNAVKAQGFEYYGIGR